MTPEVLTEIRKLAAAKRQLRLDANDLDRYMKQLDARLLELIDPTEEAVIDPGSGFVSTVTVSRSKRSKVDHDAMRLDGIDVDAYTTTTTAKRYSVTVYGR